MMDLLPKVQQIKRRLRARVEREQRPEARLPPIRELARQLGAGHVNTHRAVQALVAEGVLQSQRRRGTFIAPRGQWSSPADAFGRAQVRLPQVTSVAASRVAVLHGSVDEFLQPALDELFISLEPTKRPVVVEQFVAADPLPALERHADADVVVLINFHMAAKFHFRPEQVAVVISTSPSFHLPDTPRCDIVMVDSQMGVRLAGEHFRQLQVESTCFVGCELSKAEGQRFDLISAERLLGFEQGLGGPVKAEHQIRMHTYSTNNGAGAVADYMQMNPRPEAVFAASDELAIGFVHGCLAHRLQAGRDYQIIGFDGQARARSQAGGPLTTVAAPARQMGVTAGQLLRNRLHDPQQPMRRVMLCGALQVGTTTRALADATPAAPAGPLDSSSPF